MRLHPGEPAFGPWQLMAVTEAVDKAIRAWPANRLATLAIDGGSSSGKTTLGERIVAAIAGAVVVHTDDVAWWESVFDWVEFLVGGILEPAQRGEAVSYRPPAWDRRQRLGAISVPAGARLLIVEGVGAGRRELARYLDGVIWVQADLDLKLARDEARIAAGEVTREAYDSWMAEERPFQADQATWGRANLIVSGSGQSGGRDDRVLGFVPAR